MKRPIFAWDDEEVKLPEIKEEAPEIKSNVLSFDEAIEQIKREEEDILNTVTGVVSSEDIVNAKPLPHVKQEEMRPYIESLPSEYQSAVLKSEGDHKLGTSHIVVLVHSFYKDAAEEIGTTMEKTDTVYEWYIKTIRESMIEEENLMKISLTGLGTFQISIRCILGTLYKRMAYSEKMFEGIIAQNHRNIQFKRRALERVLVPTNIAYRKGKNKFDLLGHFPEFNNRMFKKTEEFFYIIATKLPKLYERLSRVR